MTTSAKQHWLAIPWILRQSLAGCMVTQTSDVFLLADDPSSEPQQLQTATLQTEKFNYFQHVVKQKQGQVNKTMSTKFCKTRYFRGILILWFWNAEILMHFNFAFSHFPTVLLIFTWPWIFTEFNFAFFPTLKICENFMHAKTMWFTVLQNLLCPSYCP